MKQSILSYRFVFLFAVIASLLTAVCYGPAVQKCESISNNVEESTKDEDHASHEQTLTIAQHVVTTISFSIHPDAKLPATLFEYIHFGFSSEVVDKIVSVLFSISYLENIFPFSISPQAP